MQLLYEYITVVYSYIYIYTTCEDAIKGKEEIDGGDFHVEDEDNDQRPVSSSLGELHNAPRHGRGSVEGPL